MNSANGPETRRQRKRKQSISLLPITWLVWGGRMSHYFLARKSGCDYPCSKPANMHRKKELHSALAHALWNWSALLWELRTLAISWQEMGAEKVLRSCCPWVGSHGRSPCVQHHALHRSCTPTTRAVPLLAQASCSPCLTYLGVSKLEEIQMLSSLRFRSLILITFC